MTAFATPVDWATNDELTAALFDSEFRDKLAVVGPAALGYTGIVGFGRTASPTVNGANQNHAATLPLLIDFVALNAWVTACNAAHGTSLAVYVRNYMQLNVTATNAATALAWVETAFVYGSSTITADIATHKDIRGTSIGSLTTGIKTSDSGWVTAASRTTDISAYGIATLALGYKLTGTGGTPTVTNLCTWMGVRIQ